MQNSTTLEEFSQANEEFERALTKFRKCHNTVGEVFANSSHYLKAWKGLFQRESQLYDSFVDLMNTLQHNRHLNSITQTLPHSPQSQKQSSLPTIPIQSSVSRMSVSTVLDVKKLSCSLLSVKISMLEAAQKSAVSYYNNALVVLLKNVKERNLMRHEIIKRQRKHKKARTFFAQLSPEIFQHYLEMNRQVVSDIHAFCEFSTDAFDIFLLSMMEVNSGEDVTAISISKKLGLVTAKFKALVEFSTTDAVDSVLDSFPLILSNPFGADFLRKFLEREYSSENLEFWLEVQEFKQIQHPTNLIDVAVDIYKKYLTSDSTTQINLPGTVYQKIFNVVLPIVQQHENNPINKPLSHTYTITNNSHHQKRDQTQQDNENLQQSNNDNISLWEYVVDLNNEQNRYDHQHNSTGASHHNEGISDGGQMKPQLQFQEEQRALKLSALEPESQQQILKHGLSTTTTTTTTATKTQHLLNPIGEPLITPHFYDEAQQSVFLTMKKDTHRRFVKSEYGNLLRRRLEKQSNLIQLSSKKINDYTVKLDPSQDQDILSSLIQIHSLVASAPTTNRDYLPSLLSHWASSGSSSFGVDDPIVEHTPPGVAPPSSPGLRSSAGSADSATVESPLDSLRHKTQKRARSLNLPTDARDSLMHQLQLMSAREPKKDNTTQIEQEYVNFNNSNKKNELWRQKMATEDKDKLNKNTDGSTLQQKLTLDNPPLKSNIKLAKNTKRKSEKLRKTTENEKHLNPKHKSQQKLPGHVNEVRLVDSVDPLNRRTRSNSFPVKPKIKIPGKNNN